MNSGAERRLWTVAALASLGLHGMVALALAYAPAPRPQDETVTRIDFQTAADLAAAAAPVVDAAASALAAEVAATAATVMQAVPVADAASDEAIAHTAAAVESVASVAAPATAVASVAQNDREALVAAPAVAGAAEADPVAAAVPPDNSMPQARSGAVEAAPVAAPREAEAVPVTERPASRLPAVAARPATSAGQVAVDVAAAGAPAPVAAAGPSAAATAGEATVASPETRIPPAASASPSSNIVPADVGRPSAAAVAAGETAADVAVAPASSPLATTARETATPAQPARQRLTMVWPREPAVPEPVDMAEVYSDVIAAIRASRGGSCLAALAVLAGESVRVDGFAAGSSALAASLAGEHAARLVVRDHRVSQAQCAALDFARGTPGYPAPGLSVTLASGTIDSGEQLAGRIAGVSGGWLYLLVVDDEGKVQELKDLETETGSIAFRAPLTLTTGPVGTVQLLLALASDAPLESIAHNEGEPADLYFPPLRAEIAQARAAIGLALVPFVLR